MGGIFWKTQLFLSIKEYFPLLKSHIVLILSTVKTADLIFFPCLNNYSFKTQGEISESMGMEIWKIQEKRKANNQEQMETKGKYRKKNKP